MTKAIKLSKQNLLSNVSQYYGISNVKSLLRNIKDNTKGGRAFWLYEIDDDSDDAGNAQLAYVYRNALERRGIVTQVTLLGDRVVVMCVVTL